MNKKRSLLLLLSLALLLCLALPMSASASYETAVNYTGQTTQGEYIIDSASDLATLATNVNNSTNYAGSTFYLANDITLSGAWTPIGGWNGTTGVPSGTMYFSGVFDGRGHTISGLSITSASTSGVGLFGYVNGGIVGNLTVQGSISTSSSINAIGGVIGYTNSSVVCCTSDVSISASNASNVGGVIGIVENTQTSGTPVLVQYCQNTETVSANKRLGGVIGGAYCPNASGRIYVDNCQNTGAVTSASTAYKSFCGGVIGYCEAYVSNCLNNAQVSAPIGADGIRMGGIVGILSSYGTADAKMANCLNRGSLANASSNPNYDGALCVPESATSMDNCFWIDTITNVGQLTSYSATNVDDLSAAQLQSTAQYNGYYISYYINQEPPWSEDLDNAFTCTSGSYPALTFPATAPADLSTYPTGASRTGSDSAYAGSAVYYNSAAPAGGDGSFANPYNSFETAVSAAVYESYLCVQSAIPVSDYNSYGSGLSGKTIARSYVYDGPLFDVQSGSLTLGTITLDGNSTTTGNASLINVEGGSVTIGSGVTLQNNKTMNKGAAIRVLTGSVTMNGGTVSGNTSVLGGNGIAVLSTGPSSGGTLTISPTSAISFGTGDYIFLDSGRSITVGNAGNFATYVPASSLKVNCADTSSGTVVATGVTQDLTGYFTYYGGGHSFEYNEGYEEIWLE